MRLNLPPCPDLSRLKKQAKTLQRSVNAGNASQAVRLAEHLPGYQMGDSLSLSNAQLVIAREYGFPSWPKLKRAVEQAQGTGTVDESLTEIEKETVHITCGDAQSLTLKEANIPGLRVPLRDLLNMGPLPATENMDSFLKIRMEYIKQWTKLPGLDVKNMVRDQKRHLNELLNAGRIILWLWPLLTHQLTMLLTLQWLAENNFQGDIFTVDSARYPGQYDEETILALFKHLRPVTERQVAEAQQVWSAIRQPSPEMVLNYVKAPEHELPHLRNAMLRFLEEFPSSCNGLTRTEQAVLLALKAGCRSRGEIYQWVCKQEEFPCIGDWGMWRLLSQLITADFPLVETSDGKAFVFEPAGKFNPEQQFALTALGEKICDGQEDHIVWNGCERWWGGVHLSADNVWRFDKDRMTMRREIF